MAIGVTKSLADVLRGDFTSVPASTFVARYPTIFSGGASAVPTHFYTSLKDILMPTSTLAEWQNNLVVDMWGYGKSGPDTVDVVLSRVIDGSMAEEEASNEQGAEMAEIFIYLKKGGALIAATDTDRLANGALRIQRLLDWNYRMNVGLAAAIPVTDNTLNHDYPIKCYWHGLANLPSDKSMAICFYVHYSRLFLR